MAEEQARLAASIDALIEPLEAAGIDYRVGVTTTDVVNPVCGFDTTPENGAFVFGSCRGRAEDFTFPFGGDPPFPLDVACEDQCELEPEQLDALMKPTTANYDPMEKVRPWVQSGPTHSNLPDGVSGVDALRCILPQGINGCGFESQLESMYRAVDRTWTPGDDAFGFIRDEAALAIVILTDEADCSHDGAWNEIFSTDGDKVFWSDPDAEFPTSALCWNAGVACTGGPGTYDECHAADKDVNGALTDEPGEAVLHPVSRYIDLLQSLQIMKITLQPEDDAVIFAVIAGVPEGYSPGSVKGLYADSDDPVLQEDFGIGPGCMRDGYTTLAIPPVRMRELEESFGEPHLSSVCADDYSPALARLADDIQSRMHAACYLECALDTDPDAVGLQPECFVEQEAPSMGSAEIPPCALEDGAHVLPDNEDACFVFVSDAENMSEQCIDLGSNLEFEIIRRSGVAVPDGANLRATCQLSTEPTRDCPGFSG
jgi:hypothetical protein